MKYTNTDEVLLYWKWVVLLERGSHALEDKLMVVIVLVEFFLLILQTLWRDVPVFCRLWKQLKHLVLQMKTRQVSGFSTAFRMMQVLLPESTTAVV